MKGSKFLTGILTAAMLGTMVCSTAFAADLSNGDYKGEVHFLNANGSGSTSMCDPIFVHETDVTLTDEEAQLTFYVAYPIPAFSDQGTDGTVKDVVVTYNETDYPAESDITSQPTKVFDTTASLFGINAGDELPTQVLNVSLPKEAIDDLEAGTVAVSAYVNVFMNTTQDFFLKVTDLQPVGGTEPSGDSQDMEITANVEEAVSEPSYTVTVPGSVAMGKLSADQDNSMAYTVDVEASDLNGTLSVAAPADGNLTSGENTLAFSNSFGTQTVTEDTAGTGLNGEIGVSAANVASAASGNYVGTTTFTISYAAN